MRPQIRLKRRMHKARRILPDPPPQLYRLLVVANARARARIYMIYLSGVRSTVCAREKKRDGREEREWSEKSGAEAELGWRTMLYTRCTRMGR